MAPVPPALQEALSGRYALEREAGHGGVATIYLAEDLRHRRRVAIKVLAPELAATMGSERFEHETRTAARLHHPHIVPLYDSGSAAGQLYLVMPFMEGESLASRLRREVQLPVEEARRICTEVADALKYAHANGVIHRDIKPDNILLESGHAQVADFGIARAAQAGDDTRLTGTGMMLGTPAYMSPEQAAGNANLDARSDLYSLGCTLYEMLAGQPPYTGPTPESLIYQHVSAPVPNVANLRPGVPAAVATMVTRLLQKSPADRYADAATLERDVAAAITTITAVAQAGTVASPTTAPRVGGAACRSRRVLVRTGLLAAVTIAIALGITGRCVHQPGGSAVAKITSLAVLPLANLSGDPLQEYFADGMTEELINALSRIGALRVISRTSTTPYKGAHKPLPLIAHELNVDALIEGTVARMGDRVRISASLVRAKPEQKLWGDHFDRPVANVLDLESEVAQAIVQRIRVTLTPTENARLAKHRVVNPAAYDAVLRGRSLRGSRSSANFKRAIEEFDNAIRIDSTYAEAWAGSASAWYGISSIFTPADVAMPRARHAAERALSLDEDLAGAHAALGVVLSQYDRRWRDAERELKRAIELDPNSALAHYYYGIHQLSSGAPLSAALAEMQRAHDLDPLSSETETIVAYFNYLSGDYAASVEGYRKLGAADSSVAVYHYSLAFCYVEQGRFDEASAEARRALVTPDGDFAKPAVAYILARAGHVAEARRLLDGALKESNPSNVQPYFNAMAYSGLGNHREALRWLNRGCDVHDEALVALQADPAFRELRKEPGYQDLLKRMNLGS